MCRDGEEGLSCEVTESTRWGLLAVHFVQTSTEGVCGETCCRDHAVRVRIERWIYQKKATMRTRARVGVESDKWDLLMGFLTERKAGRAEEHE